MVNNDVETVDVTPSNGYFKVLWLSFYRFLLTKHIGKSFLVMSTLSFLATILFVYYAHQTNFNKYLIDIPLLSNIADVIDERQYVCLNETGIGNGVQLCLEKDFWPIKRKEKCLVYSFTMKEYSEAETSLMKWGCSVHFFDPRKTTSTILPNGLKIHPVAISYRNESQYGPYNWNMLTLGSIRKKLKHSASAVTLLLLDIDGTVWNGCVERILERILTSGEFRCILQMQVTFHLSGRISEHMVEFKRIQKILSVLMRYYSVGFRSFSVSSNLPKNRDFIKTILFTPLQITWKIAYVNMRPNYC